MSSHLCALELTKSMLINSSCHLTYKALVQEKLDEFKSGETLIDDKRYFNVYLAAIEGEGNYTFGEIFHRVELQFNDIQPAEVLAWFRYGFISGDFCPLFPFISGYYNWDKVQKYISKAALNHGYVPPIDELK